MIRNACLILALCLFTSAADAQVIKAVKHRVADKKFWISTAISVGSSIAASATINRCRHDHGIGPCTDGGYGEFKTREGLRQGLPAFLILPTYKIKQIEDEDGSKYKYWWLLQAANAGVNVGVIIQNKRKHYGPREIEEDRHGKR